VDAWYAWFICCTLLLTEPACDCAVQGCCSDVVNVVSTSQIDIDCKDLSRKAPLLLTELVVTPEGTSFTYSTPIDSMHSKIIAVFDRAITKLQVSCSARTSHPHHKAHECTDLRICADIMTAVFSICNLQVTL
jgi:hypothetical protein